MGLVLSATVLVFAVVAGVCAASRTSRWSRSYVARTASDDPKLTVRSAWLLSSHVQMALTAALTVPVAVCAWRSVGPALGLVAIVATVTAATAGSVDAVCHRLPNRILCVGGAVLVVAELVAASASGSWEGLWGAVRGALLTGGVLLALALVPSGLGMGDFKLMAVMGAWLGWFGVAAAVAAMVLGIMIAGVPAIALLVTRRVERKTPMAYGPYLGVGALLMWFLLVL